VWKTFTARRETTKNGDMKKRRVAPPRFFLRLGTGLTLVAVSVLSAVVVLDTRGALRPVFFADQRILPGSEVGNSDVSIADLAENAALDPYFGLTNLESVEGLVANREIRPGELLRREDFVEPTVREDSVLTVSQTVGQPRWLAPGQVVQIWVAPPVSENSFSAPFVLSPEAVIARVSQDEGFAANGQESLVDIRVPSRDVPAMIHALANQYFVHLAPVAPMK